MKAQNIELVEWKEILRMMKFQKITEGYIVKLLRKIALYKTKPSFGGLYVTKENIIKHIKTYKK